MSALDKLPMVAKGIRPYALCQYMYRYPLLVYALYGYTLVPKRQHVTLLEFILRLHGLKHELTLILGP